MEIRAQKVVTVVIDDSDPVWIETPNEETLRREAVDIAYRTTPNAAYITAGEKQS